MSTKNKKGDTLGARIRYYRERKGMSQQDLADEVNFKTGTAISLIESDSRGVDANDLLIFAKALNVTVPLLINEDSVPDFSMALRSDKSLSKDDAEQVMTFYNYVKSGKGKSNRS